MTHTELMTGERGPLSEMESRMWVEFYRWEARQARQAEEAARRGRGR